MGIGSIIVIHLSTALWKAKFSILWCNISGEAGEEIRNWSPLGVKGLNWSRSAAATALSFHKVNSGMYLPN